MFCACLPVMSTISMSSSYPHIIQCIMTYCDLWDYTPHRQLYGLHITWWNYSKITIWLRCKIYICMNPVENANTLPFVSSPLTDFDEWKWSALSYLLHSHLSGLKCRKLFVHANHLSNSYKGCLSHVLGYAKVNKGHKTQTACDVLDVENSVLRTVTYGTCQSH